MTSTYLIYRTLSRMPRDYCSIWGYPSPIPAPLFTAVGETSKQGLPYSSASVLYLNPLVAAKLTELSLFAVHF